MLKCNITGVLIEVVINFNFVSVVNMTLKLFLHHYVLPPVSFLCNKNYVKLLCKTNKCVFWERLNFFNVKPFPSSGAYIIPDINTEEQIGFLEGLSL